MSGSLQEEQGFSAAPGPPCRKQGDRGRPDGHVIKNRALHDLDVFMAAFLKVARIVFEYEPQQFEKLGITVPYVPV